MFSGIHTGFEVMGKSILFFFKHPKTIFPIFMAWLIYTGVITYVFTIIDFEEYNLTEALIAAYIFTFLFTFLVSLSSLVLLELLEQNETEEKMSILKASKDAFTKDLIRTLPIIIGWSIIKFLLLILEVLIRSAEGKNKKSDSSFSRSRSSRRNRRSLSFLETIKTGVRMGVMIILSAIAWEDLKPKDAVDKGMYVYKKHFTSMATGVALSRVLSFVIFFPMLILLIGYGEDILINEYLMYGVVLYTGLAWSYGILVEQLFTAELYLWYKIYSDQVALAKRNDTNGPASINEVQRPSFIDDIPDMISNENTFIDPDYEW